jgi:hypothetical protein
MRENAESVVPFREPRIELLLARRNHVRKHAANRAREITPST